MKAKRRLRKFSTSKGYLHANWMSFEFLLSSCDNLCSHSAAYRSIYLGSISRACIQWPCWHQTYFIRTVLLVDSSLKWLVVLDSVFYITRRFHNFTHFTFLSFTSSASPPKASLFYFIFKNESRIIRVRQQISIVFKFIWVLLTYH